MADPCDDIDLIDLFVQIEIKLSTMEANPDQIVQGVRRGLYDLKRDLLDQEVYLLTDIKFLELQNYLKGFFS